MSKVMSLVGGGSNRAWRLAISFNQILNIEALLPENNPSCILDLSPFRFTIKNLAHSRG